MATLRFDQDLHVHSTFSDGVGTPSENIEAAEARGVVLLGCVDHVRRDSTYLPEFATAIRLLSRRTRIDLVVGAEAKLVNTDGELDAPDDLSMIDFVYAADHQVPSRHGCLAPRVVRDALRARTLLAQDVIADIVLSYTSVFRRYDRVLLAHPFSVLPKCGLSENDVSDAQVASIAEAARRFGGCVEIDERWRCPSARIVAIFADASVPVFVSSDSHRPDDIAEYRFARDVASTLVLGA